MSFPNAQKGIKKLFIGEMLMLIAVILSTVSGIAMLIAGVQEGGSGVIAVGLILFSLASALLTVIALVFSIIGVIQTAKDEQLFKGVIIVMLLSLAVVVISAIFTENQAVAKLSDVITNISSTITTVLIVIGIGRMAEKCGDEAVFGKGQTLLKIIVWIALLSVIMKAIAAFIPYTAVMAVEIIMMIVTGVLEVMQYFLYLSFLSKAKRMLA